MNPQEVTRGVYRKFFSSLGFDDDPFQYTNADEEDRLSDYFVPPSYFPSVFGDPIHPKTFVVFAPRGGGKSAQRRIIEANCEMHKVLSITYDQFEFPDVKKASEIALNHHLKNIIRYSLLGLLVTLHSNPTLQADLSTHDREVFVKLAAIYLSGINEISIKRSLDSLKSLKDKVKDFWNEWLPIIQVGLTTFLKKYVDSNLDSLEKYTKADIEQSTYPKYQFELVVQLAQKLGFKSIYILIDRVDEAALTGNNAPASFQLVEPLLRDLDLLEMNGVAFKFFLWDRLEPQYSKIARTDRIRQETLEWDDAMLMTMWQKRLKAFSKGNISSLNDITEPQKDPSPDELALVFANHSPRDMIRLGAQIISEQQEIDLSAGKISLAAIYKGIEKFSLRRANEVVNINVLNDLRKVGQLDFTIPHLANVIFREKQSTTRNRIMRWRAEGAIVDVERIDNPNPQQKTQVKIMAIQDIRVAKVICSNTDVIQFVRKKYKKCPSCGATLLRDWGDADSASRCHECQFDLNSDLDSWESWRRKLAAAETRKKNREEQVFIQESLFDHLASQDGVVGNDSEEDQEEYKFGE